MNATTSSVGPVSRFVALMAVLGFVQASAVEPKVATVDEFRTAMKDAGEAFAVITMMTPTPAYLLNSVRGDELTQVAIVRSQMAASRTFLSAKRSADGVRLSDEMLDALDDLDAILRKSEPDQAAAIDAVEEVDKACAACHRSMREGNERTGYRFRPGIVG
ncbi:MAG TPA: hypothetical protein VGY48_03760 [Vicinamibacterales bacterium]|nr:hypothetical protein [Vicinamibacterales bacterium]